MIDPSVLQSLVGGYSEHEHLEIRQETYMKYGLPKELNLFKWVVEKLELRPNDWVLDAGCGNGAFHESASRYGAGVVALDYSPAITRFLSERDPEANKNVRIICASADAIPLQDSSCDAAMVNFMLHYFSPEGRQQVLAEIRRVVRPGGIVVSANFSANLIERLRHLHHEAAAAVGYEADTSDFGIFNMDFVGDWHAVFPDVQTKFLESRIVVTEVAPLLRYYSSFILDKVRQRSPENKHRRPMIEWMANRVSKILQAEGSFEDTTSAGVFLARVR